MTQSIFTGFNSNQRVIAIPPIPTVSATGTINAATTVTLPAITLSSNNTTNGQVYSFIYFFCYYEATTAAAAAMILQLQWQFRNAAHANVGGAIAAPRASVNTAGGTGGTITNVEFLPATPFTVPLTIPATAAELCLQIATLTAGNPVVDYVIGWGIDISNNGTAGDIGGAGMQNQGATNPNTF